MLQVRLGTSWQAMVPELASAVRETLTSPFHRGLVVVEAPGSARLLSQEIAQLDGIFAGTAVLTLPQLLAKLADDAGVKDQWDAWRGPRLITAIHENIDAVAARHVLLAASLTRPGRKFATCARLARLLRSYAEHAPTLIASWLDGDDGDLPPHLTWQPELLRSVCEQLSCTPVDIYERMTTAATTLGIPAWIFCADEIPSAAVPILMALQPATGWFLESLPDWLRDQSHASPVHTGKPLRAVARVAIHGSHSRIRQAEVLRDELTRRFEQDPMLEPRDVRIVCPEPQVWAPVLNSVFRATSRHPGRALRVAEVAPPTGGNHAIDALLAAMSVVDGRATASQVVEFLLLPGIADRWGFAAHRQDLLELVEASQIRWGLDAKHRSSYGLDNAATNTWLSGIDALLTGVAMGGVPGPRGVLGVDRTTSNDLDLIGALAEVIGRLWQFNEATSTPLRVSQWCDQASLALERLVGLRLEDQWMQRQAVALLARLARAHEHSTMTLTRGEFRSLLEADLPSRWHRPALGNGQLHVVTPNEARHVDAKLVVLIGLEDTATCPQPDEIPGILPDSRKTAQQHLLAQARCAHDLVVITQTRSERTGALQQLPVAIRLLMRQLGVTVPDVVQHAPQPFNVSAFTADSPPSFDAAAYAGAVASATPRSQPLVVERRRCALTLPIGDAPRQLTLAKLRTFLLDPAKELVANLVNLHVEVEPELADQLPLVLDGLQRWQLTDTFLQGRLDGVDPQVLLRRAQQSQLLPPGDFGRAMAIELGQKVDDVAQRAQRLMAEQPRPVTIDLQLGHTRLTGSVQLYGDTVVVPASSSGAKAQLGPWLNLLALAASGERAQAVVFRPGMKGTKHNRLRQPPPERAVELLELYIRACTMGRSRLLPVPFDPAFSLVMEQRTGRFHRRDWTHPQPGAWRKWKYPGELWLLFYQRPAQELFFDAPTDEDPPGASGSGFERWAQALYQPLVEQGASW